MRPDVLEQPAPDRRHGPGDRRPFGLDQPDQRLGLQEPVRHDQVRAGQHRRVGQPPRVGVEHGHHGEHPVLVGQGEHVAQADPHRVQVGGPVAVHHALGHPGRAARVAHGGGGPLVDLRPAERVRGSAEQFLVQVHLVTRRRPARRPSRSPAGPGQHDVPDRRQVRQHLGQQRDQGGLGDDHVVAGVVGDVADLRRVEPEVERVQHRAHRGDGQVGLQVLGVVPEQGGDPLVTVHAEFAQRVGQPGGAGPGLRVGLAAHAVRHGRDDLTVPIERSAVPHQRGYGQGHVHHRAEHGPPPRSRPGAGRTGPHGPARIVSCPAAKRHPSSRPASIRSLATAPALRPAPSTALCGYLPWSRHRRREPYSQPDSGRRGPPGLPSQTGCARRNRPKCGTVNAISPRSEL